MPEHRMEEVGVCEPVQLEPFVHQVGGHSGMFCFDETTVCKPRIPREQKFYEMMPKCMRRFTPEYRGTVGVSFREDSDGYVTLVAHPPNDSLGKDLPPRHSPIDSSVNSGGEEGRSDSDSECSGSRAGGSAKQRFRIQRSGSIEIEGVPADLSERSDKQQQVLSRGHKPWSLKCHKQQITRMHQSLQHDDNAHKFILLENLASQFELPCILDLKMGQRQHGDNASEQKRLNQTKKCKNTTSSSLGTRISGMQVYQSDTCHFLCHSKYYGRQLDEKGVEDALRQFLHNGRKLRLDLLDPLVDRLSQLYSLLKQQNTFRFYSSSLLIMYDGDEDAYDDQQSPQEVDSGDSAVGGPSPDLSGSGTGCSQHSCSSNSSGVVMSPDGRCCSMCSSSISTSGVGGCSSSNSLYSGSQGELLLVDRVEHSSGVGGGVDINSPNSSSSLPPPKPCEHYFHKRRRRQRKVDVRMIDFAHSTYQGFRGDKTKHEGPDHGYLFGIQNLITLFRELKQQHEQSVSGNL